MNYSNVMNPQWGDAEQNVINCIVDFEGIGQVPFAANPNDMYEHGKQIFADCAAGKYGPVAAYVPPPPSVPPAAANKAEAERRLAATDWVNQPDVYDPANTPHLTNRDAFIAYRSALRAIAVNPTEGNLEWPTEPASIWSEV